MEERGEKQRQVSNKKEQIFLQQYHQKMEQEIIQPIDKELLKQELTPERQLRMTNKSNNEIYVVTAHEAPNVMKEIGRLREIAFREAGGGTGKSMDIDEFDTMPNSYKQLIVWNPEAEEIIGGYRYILGTDVDVDANGQPVLATSHMFHFSDKFMKEYMPQTIELGRSFVALPYQSSRMGAKSLFALDNLWDGIGSAHRDNAEREVFLRQDDHVSLVYPQGQGYDIVFPEEAFRRQGEPRDTDGAAQDRDRPEGTRRDILRG